MGGVTRTLQLATRAGLDCAPHCANLSLVSVYAMHLLGTISNAGIYLEFSIECDDYHPWQKGLFLGHPFAVTDGAVSIPEPPG